ncbi:MAG: YpsA SLOG family protein [Desulfobacterales bacterium]
MAFPGCEKEDRDAAGKQVDVQIKKIISGGSPGAETAALDAAIQFSIPYGGYAPGGADRINSYALEERAFESWIAQAKANMAESDGVLVFSHGAVNEQLALLIETAKDRNFPWYHIDFEILTPFQAGVWIDKWAGEHSIGVLFVTGSLLREDFRIVEKTNKAVYTALMLGMSREKPSSMGLKAFPDAPRTVDQAVQVLIEKLQLKEKVRIANMNEEDLATLNSTLGMYIRNKFGLVGGNQDLLQSCADAAIRDFIYPDEASAVIIALLAHELAKTHRLRIV